MLNKIQTVEIKQKYPGIKRTNVDSKNNRYHQNQVSRIMWWKLVAKVPCNKYTKDNNWNDDQQ